MGISLQPRHLQRYKDIALLFAKYGHGDLLHGSDFSDDALERRHQPAPVPPKAGELAADLERLGPTFIKLGQLLSTRADFLPPAYMQGLARLQDHVAPFSFEEVEAIIPVEIGARISKAFSFFEKEPMASASLGQVHRAALRDGRPVAVKVQRPDIRGKMMDDLDALTELAEFLDAHTEAGRRFEFTGIIGQFRKSLLAELDYRQEAQNLKVLHERLKGFESIVVPRPVEDFTTSRVLTMDYVPGKKITSLSPIVRLDLDGGALAEQLFRAYLQQILVDGLFHADPHPGNIFITEDHRVALIDLGMVGRIAPKMQDDLLQLLLAISEGRSEAAAGIAIKIGDPKDDFDEIAFRRRIGEIVMGQKDATVEQMQVGKVVLDVNIVAAESRIRVPQELSMLGKTLLNLDLVGRTLDKTFDPNASIRRNAAAILQQRLVKSLAPGNFVGGLLEVKDLVERLPERLNKILDAVANNNLRVKVDTIDEEVFMAGLQKIANRITVGLIIAALIVGAAMLMRVDTSFKILGYPGFAIICFMAAAGTGMILVYKVLRNDTDSKP